MLFRYLSLEHGYLTSLVALITSPYHNINSSLIHLSIRLRQQAFRVDIIIYVAGDLSSGSFESG